MIKRFFTNLAEKFKAQSPTTQGFIIVGILLIIGIIVRWKFILEEMARGFSFFSK